MSLIGAFVGSFLGVLIYRIPRGISALKGRSACENCSTYLLVYDLVPLLSFIWLRGRCRFCNVAIRKEHIAIEIGGGIVAAVCAATIPATLQMVCATVLGWGLLTLAWIDASYFILPDAVTLPLIPAGLIATSMLEPGLLMGHGAGALLGYVTIYGVNNLYRAFRHRDGIGEGDAKLMAVAGAWLGWEILPWIIVLAAIFGLLFAIFLRVFYKNKLVGTMRLPFGACLAPSIFLFYMINASDSLSAINFLK